MRRERWPAMGEGGSQRTGGGGCSCRREGEMHEFVEGGAQMVFSAL